MAVARIKQQDAQQAQNALDHLQKHHLLIRTENDGSVKDKSHFLYDKDPTVRANRQAIVRYADKKNLAKQVPTKRQPFVNGITVIRTVSRAVLKKKKKLKVLYLTANPSKKHSLRVDAEVRQVQDAVRGSAYRDSIGLEYRPAANLKSLIDGLNDVRPNLIHFSGHGWDGGLQVDHDTVQKRSPAKFLTFDLLAKALGATDSPPQIVVLNACESSGAKNALIPPTKAIVAMRKSISDLAAAAFATAFYAGVASGQSLKSAFRQGCIAIEVTSFGEQGIPELILGSNVDPRKIVLT
jgi:CHAT domain